MAYSTVLSPCQICISAIEHKNHFSVGERFGGISNTRQGASCSIDGRIDVFFGRGKEPCGGGRDLWGAPTSREQGGAGGGVQYGDLNCIDSSHMVAPCFWLLLEFMDYASNNVLSTTLTSMSHEVTGNDPLSSRTLEQRVQLKPTRRTESNKVMVEVASKVLKGGRVGDSCFRASESRK